MVLLYTEEQLMKAYTIWHKYADDEDLHMELEEFRSLYEADEEVQALSFMQEENIAIN
tara:strand:+ start:539 stop:712 length:174 start_codon:yes stop_codon:yes gene_type:complete